MSEGRQRRRPAAGLSGAAAAAAVAAAFMSLGAAAPTPAAAQAKKPAPQASAPAPAAARVSNHAERYATLCAACHGANGRSDMAGVPVLAGQPALYSITQLFLFREGRRDNEAMVAVAKTMTDADLRGFSDFIGSLPPVPPPPPATPPDPARLAKGRALAQQHKCMLCHGEDLAGGQQVPRIGGQKEDYLLRTLKQFKAGERPGYTRAMTEALSQVPVEDLDLLAYYAAHAR
jgi:cytochrome c553